MLTEELLKPANGARALPLNFSDSLAFRCKTSGPKYLKAKGVETRKITFVESKALAPKGAVAELDPESAPTKQLKVSVSPALGSEGRRYVTYVTHVTHVTGERLARSRL